MKELLAAEIIWTDSMQTISRTLLQQETEEGTRREKCQSVHALAGK